jgi:folate-binding protein YgfZ
LDTIQNHLNYQLKISIFRLATLHKPAEHVLIFTGQQLAIALLIGFIEGWKHLTHKRHQQQVQLQHAAPAMPKQPVKFSRIDHAAAPNKKTCGIAKIEPHYSDARRLPAPADKPATALYDDHPDFMLANPMADLAFSDLALTEALHTDSAFFCVLAHEGLLAVRGPDASKLLQGQLTCNLNYLDEHSASLGARCTPKGRMLSSFRILQQGDGYLLAMATELLSEQLAELQKYAVFSKSKLTDASALWVRFGLQGGDAVLTSLGLELQAASDSIARHAELIALRLSDGRCELWAPRAHAEQLQAQLAAQLAPAPLNSWLLAQVRAGIGQVFGATREAFIPQMINLQALGGVSFKKGCYTGQEIVARMQYLGKLKRRLYRLSLAGSDIPALATPLFSPIHASSVGDVVLAARSDNGVELLAVLQEDALNDGRIYLASLEGNALQRLELPYTLDSDREIQR